MFFPVSASPPPTQHVDPADGAAFASAEVAAEPDDLGLTSGTGKRQRGSEGELEGEATRRRPYATLSSTWGPTKGFSSAVAWSQRLSATFLCCEVCGKHSGHLLQFIPKRMLVCPPCGAGLGSSERGAGLQELPLQVLELLRRIEERASAASPTGSVDRRSASPVLQVDGVADVGMTMEELLREEDRDRQRLVESESSALVVLRSRVCVSMKMKADSLYDKGKFELALRLWTEAMKFVDRTTSRDVSLLHSNRSAAHFMLLQYKECCEDCTVALTHAEKRYNICLRGARAAWIMGDLQLALNFLNKVPFKEHNEEYDRVLTRCKKGLRILQSAEKETDGDHRETYFRMLTTLFSDSYAFRLRLAETFMIQEKYQAAAQMLEVIPVFARPPSLCMFLAQCYYNIGFERMEDAIETLISAAKKDKECETLLRTLQEVDSAKQDGNQAYGKKLFERAIQHYTIGIQKAAANNRILRILYSNRAAANMKLLKYRESIEDCSRAVSNDPQFAKAYARRARCHLALDDAFAAVEDFKKAVQLDVNKEDPGLEAELRDAEAALVKESKRDKDYYYQLSVSKTSTDKEIRAKFRELSLRWHPDKCVSLSDTEKARAEVKFKLINEAYSVLSDPQKRREYDYKSSVLGGNFGSDFGYRTRTRNTGTKYW